MILFYTLLTSILIFYFFFFNDTTTTEIYTLSLHDALPICRQHERPGRRRRTDRALPRSHRGLQAPALDRRHGRAAAEVRRSEEHTSELQSRENLVCRLLLEKKKINIIYT